LANGIDDRKKNIRDEIEIYKNELNQQSTRRNRDFGNRIIPYDNNCI
jgi:hypothetical protein